jgi:uncharacterized metal-binding protein YceD (DUF177 family)
LDGLSLIEDELLMDMPILPKHDNCQSEYLQTSDVGEPEEKAKPFAALAHWRKPSPRVIDRAVRGQWISYNARLI